MNPLLKRYSQTQIEVIKNYWDTIRWTRSTGKVSDGIKLKELVFWDKYPVETVIQALQTHTHKHPNTKEHYTRGIIRNLSKGQVAKYDSPTVKKTKSGYILKPHIPIVEPSTEESVSDEEFARLMEMARKYDEGKNQNS